MCTQAIVYANGRRSHDFTSLRIHPTVPYCLQDVMVNFHDPKVMERDARAYDFSAMLYELASIPTPLLIVALSKLWHSVCGIYMWVCQYHETFAHNSTLSLDGNTSPLSSMNGVSFEDVVPTIGRYGSVDIYTSLISAGPASSQTDLFVRHSIDLLPCTIVRPRNRSARIYHC